MYYNVKISNSDKKEFDALLDRYIRIIGKQIATDVFTTCGELQNIGKDFDLIVRIRIALEEAEELQQ